MLGRGPALPEVESGPSSAKPALQTIDVSLWPSETNFKITKNKNLHGHIFLQNHSLITFLLIILWLQILLECSYGVAFSLTENIFLFKLNLSPLLLTVRSLENVG